MRLSRDLNIYMSIDLQLVLARNKILNSVNLFTNWYFEFFRGGLVGMADEKSEGDMERAVEWIWVGCSSQFSTFGSFHRFYFAIKFGIWENFWQCPWILFLCPENWALPLWRWEATPPSPPWCWSSTCWSSSASPRTNTCTTPHTMSWSHLLWGALKQTSLSSSSSSKQRTNTSTLQCYTKQCHGCTCLEVIT